MKHCTAGENGAADTPTGAGRVGIASRAKRLMMIHMSIKGLGMKPPSRLKNMTTEERHEELLQLVETTMENNDLMPLVRCFFPIFFGCFDPINTYFLIIKINNFRGDLSDVFFF